MAKRLTALFLSVLMILCLAACGGGGGGTGPTGGSNAANPQGGTPSETKKPAGQTVGDLGLTAYEDPDFGYTMLCPDTHKDSYAYSDYWFYKDKDGGYPIFFAFSEYQPEYAMHSEEALSIKDPKGLFDYFFPIMAKVLSSAYTTHMFDDEIGEVSWKELKVSGLTSGSFSCKVGTSKGEKGLTGICVAGEKRPYVFWAVDLSEDQTYLDMAREVLEACVANFKEGS